MLPAWYICDYKPLIGSYHSTRYCSMDILTPMLGDTWEEWELPGNIAVVKVQSDLRRLSEVGHNFISIKRQRDLFGLIHDCGVRDASQLHREWPMWDRPVPRQTTPAEHALWERHRHEPIGYTRKGQPIWAMIGGAFPTVTTLIDDFNRAAIGATWTTGSFYGDAAVSINASTTLTGVSFAGGYKNDADYGPDLDDMIDISTASNTAGDQPNLLFRLANGNSPNGYGFCTNVGASTVTGRIIRIAAGSNTQLGATFTITALASGHKIGANMTGSVINAYQYTGGAWGASLANRSDITYTAAGKIGVEIQTGLLDNLSGGTISATKPRIPMIVRQAVNRSGSF